jgi:hypothetical protein
MIKRRTLRIYVMPLARFFPSMMKMSFLLMLLSACILSKTDIGDGGFISEKPCGPPCFIGLTPGLSSEAETRQVLEDEGILDECQTYNNELESGSRGIRCNLIINISFRKGQDHIEGIGFRPVEEITLNEVISTYGDPNGVLLITGGTSQEHPPLTVMLLYYDAIQTRLILPQQDGEIYHVEESTPILDVVYFESSVYQSLKNFPLQKWNNYGFYKQSE